MVKAKKMMLRRETVRNLDYQPTSEPMEICTRKNTTCTSDCSGPCTAC